MTGSRRLLLLAGRVSRAARVSSSCGPMQAGKAVSMQEFMPSTTAGYIAHAGKSGPFVFPCALISLKHKVLE